MRSSPGLTYSGVRAVLLVTRPQGTSSSTCPSEAVGACTAVTTVAMQGALFLRLGPDLEWSQSSPTMSPPLFSLSNELLIEIFSNLSPSDIYACRRTCRQLNELIVNSQLLQYVLQTALGVFDPDPLDPGLSLPDRLDALRRWVTAWMELDLREPNASIDAPVPAKSGPPVEFSFGRYFVVIREGYDISAGYSFLDMHAMSSPHTTAALWTTIEINTPNVLVFAFAPELNLAVAISCVRSLVSVLILFLKPRFLLNLRRIGHRPL
jgi:hypothetical protein